MSKYELAPIPADHEANLATELELAEQLVGNAENPGEDVVRSVMYGDQLIGIIGATEYWGDDTAQSSYDTYVFRAFGGKEGRTVIIHRPSGDSWRRTEEGFNHDISVATGPLVIEVTTAESVEEAIDLVVADITSDDDPKSRIDSHLLETDDDDYEELVATLDEELMAMYGAAAERVTDQRKAYAEAQARRNRHLGHAAIAAAFARETRERLFPTAAAPAETVSKPAVTSEDGDSPAPTDEEGASDDEERRGVTYPVPFGEGHRFVSDLEPVTEGGDDPSLAAAPANGAEAEPAILIVPVTEQAAE